MVRWRPASRKLGLWAASLCLFFFAGCELEEGWPWVRNMFDFPAPGPQEEATLSPEHTLPVEGGELRDFPSTEGAPAGLETMDLETGWAERGEALFVQYCAACHGQDGKGKEMTEDYFAPDVTEADYLDYPEADLYALLVEGGLSMPNYREELSEQDRWLVIRYLRRLQAGP